MRRVCGVLAVGLRPGPDVAVPVADGVGTRLAHCARPSRAVGGVLVCAPRPGCGAAAHVRPVGQSDRTEWTTGVPERRAHPNPNAPTPVRVPELDDTYDDGVDARRRAAAELNDLDEVFDALDHQMAALLARTEQLLEHTA